MKHIVHRMSALVAEAGIVVALAGFAVSPALAECQPQPNHSSRTGTLKLPVETSVSGLTLPAGEYELKQVNRSEGPVLRVTRVTYNPTAQEGSFPYDWEKLAEVKVTAKPLRSKATHTRLLLAADNRTPIGVEIRGSTFDYLF